MSATDANRPELELVSNSTGKVCLVALQSPRCFVVPLSAGDSKLSGSELRYELESHVLIDAESIIYAVLQSTENSNAIAIVADGIAIADEFPDQISKSVIAVCPRTCLIVQGFLKLLPAEQAKAKHCLLIESESESESESGSATEVVLVENRQLIAWKYCSNDLVQDVARTLIESYELPPLTVITRIRGCHEEPTAIENKVASLAESESLQLVDSQSSTDALFQLGSRAILNGNELPIVNLKGDCLPHVDPRKPAAFSSLMWIASMVALGIFLIAGLYFRAEKYRSETADIVAQQEALFKQVFPKQKIPVGMMSRFQSEHRRLKLTRGTESRPTIPNSLEVLHAFLHSLTSDELASRFQIQGVRFEMASMSSFLGRVSTLEGLDRFRQSLEKGGFTLPPISGRPDAQGVPMQWSGAAWTRQDERNAQNTVEPKR